MKKIFIILFGKKTYKLDKFRHEIDEYQKLGFKVEIHEHVNFLYPDKKFVFLNPLKDKRIISFKNLKDWKLHMIKVIREYGKNNILIYNEIRIDSFKAFLVNYLINSKEKLNVIESNCFEFPEFLVNINYKSLKNLFNRIFFSPKKIYYIISFYFLKCFKFFPNINSKYLLVYGKKNERNYLNYPKQKIILGNGFEYNSYLSGKYLPEINLSTTEYAVYLENPTPLFNGDSVFYGLKSNHAVSPLKWLRSINNFFDILEKKTKLKIYISPHPKAKHKKQNPSYYGGRKILNDFAFVNCRKAKLIISRGSTGSAFAAIYNIPIIFIYSDEIEKNYKKNFYNIFKLAQVFGKTPININNFDIDLLMKGIFSKNESIYQEYKKNYLTSLSHDVKNSKLFVDLLGKEKNMRC